MIKVTIASSAVNVIPYTDKKGQPAQMRLQSAYAHVVDNEGVHGLYPEKFEFPLAREALPFPPGEYTYHASALHVRNNRLQMSDNRLVPIIKAKSVQAA